MIVGGSETKLPEKKPKSTQNTIRAPTEEIGTRQRQRMPEMMAQGTMTLNGPTLSATKFGAIRPKTEAELRMAKR